MKIKFGFFFSLISVLQHVYRCLLLENVGLKLHAADVRGRVAENGAPPLDYSRSLYGTGSGWNREACESDRTPRY